MSKCGDEGCSYCGDDRLQYTEREYDREVCRANDAQDALASAVARLREIAALKTVSKRQRVNCELAINWLYDNGYALTEGGYIAGKGFEEDKP